MITAQSDQITRFLARIDDGNYDSPDANATQVVFGGALELDREQEDRMCDWAFDELDNLMDDLGHPGHGGYQDDNASIADLNTFFGKRRLYELMYHKRVAWRKFGFGGIFAVSNLHLPIIRRIIQQQIARAMNYFFGTEPFFSASPQGQEDEIKASQINRYAQWKFRKAEVRQTYEAAVEKAMIRGEAVIKTTYERRSRFYEDFLTVAIDPKTKEPLLANDGDYIQQDDAIVPAINPETNEPEMQEDGVTPIMVLERDPTTEMPTGEMTWLTGKFTRERVTFEGPRADLVYYLDYLCAETAESAEAAPMVAHLYEIPATQITQAYLDRDSETGGDNSEKPKILELLREAAGLRAEQRIAALKAEIAKPITLQADIAQAQAQIETLRAQLDGLQDKTVTVTVSTVQQGAAAPADAVPSFSSGGYTGPGGKFQPAGIVHAGEYVLRKEVVRQAGVMGFLHRLNRDGVRALRGYSSGGLVSRIQSPTAASASATRELQPAYFNIPGVGQVPVQIDRATSRTLEKKLRREALKVGR